MRYSDTGYKSLIAAILQRAVNDYNLNGIVTMEKNTEWGKQAIKKQATIFLRSEDCEIYCDFIGIDYVALLKALGIELPKWMSGKKARGLDSENRKYSAFRLTGSRAKSMA